jgi:serine phosphatase RsbU (regulator of sigma subunit)
VEQKNDQLVRSQSELRRQEEEVRLLNKDLEKRVAERTEQLKNAMAKQQQEAQERQRIEQELHVARLIQQTLLPKSLPEFEGHQIAAYYQPAREVGGDFYDFLSLEDGRLGLIVGDVSGKGVPAAIVMAITRTMLQAAYRMGSAAPGEILEQVNNILYKDIPPNMFVTCLGALLDRRSGRLQYANAGHDLPYLRHAEGVSELRATGMPLGLMPGMSYEQKEITLKPGDSVLLYSDGLVEAHGPQRQMFGFPRMQEFVGAHPGGATLIDSLLAELERFTGEEWEQEDDITLLTLQRFRS